MSSVFVLGVAGGSGSGKTTLVDRLLAMVGPERVACLHHDSYYRPLDGADPASWNFDHPDALETDLLVEHLLALKAGRPVEVPLYDFATHSRRPETRAVAPGPVVLVEGILILADPRVRQELDLAVFVDAEADLRLLRRLRRDVRERGRSWESVLEQYEQFVRPMHERFVEPSRRVADVIVPGLGAMNGALEVLAARVERMLETAGA